MFTEDFIEDLTARIATKVFTMIEQRAASEKTGLAEWLDRYGPVMTRDEVAAALKMTKRHVINLEEAGKVQRAPAPGKQVKYETAQIFQLATNKRQRYATSQ